MSKNSTISIIKETQNKTVDLRATIEKAMSLDLFGLKHACVAPLNHENESRDSVPELMGLTFDDYADSVDEAFYEKVMECKDENAVYIALACLAPQGEDSYLETGSQKVLKFTEDLIDEIGLDPATDFGIKVDKNDKITFGIRYGAIFPHSEFFEEFKDDGDISDLESLNCPIAQSVIEIINGNIIFQN